LLNTEFSPWPFFSVDEIDAVSKVLLSNKVNYWTGTECLKFEKEFANYCNTSYAVALSNGSVALELALRSLGVGRGDEVIVTPRTFVATISSIVLVGATPIFVDVERNSQNISIESIEPAITDKTSAIICVHLAGQACEMDSIMELADSYGIFVIEDCAQAHGAKYKERPVGSIGHVGTWSFCQDKILTTGGEGGMVTTNHEHIWRNIWSYKDHGKNFEAVHKLKHSNVFQWLHDSIGSNYRMTEMQGAIGRIQLRKLTVWNDHRRKNAEAILNTCKQFSSILRITKPPSYIQNAWYKCYIFIRPEGMKDRWSRDRIIEEINNRGVPCYTGVCPEVYLEKAFKNRSFKPDKRLAVAKELGETSLMFLVHPTLTTDEVAKTCDIISKVMQLASI
jgi:dTDP-4-amino-4,6-dideoxygalactose transaminase